MPQDDGLPFAAENFQRDFDRTVNSFGDVGLHFGYQKVPNCGVLALR